jgi:hypothetical protein
LLDDARTASQAVTSSAQPNREPLDNDLLDDVRAVLEIIVHDQPGDSFQDARDLIPKLRARLGMSPIINFAHPQPNQQPVAMTQVYRCKIKSRKQIDREIPRDKQGWWADISAGQLIRLRQATKADLDRCTLNGAHSKDPEDYMCETHTNGSLVSKVALEYMNAEQNVFAAIGDTHPQPKQPLTDESKDAQRYRLLRRGQQWSVINGIGDVLRADALDAAIDAAANGIGEKNT